MSRIIVISVLILIMSGSYTAQTVINFKLGYIGLHPGKNPNSGLYENRISTDGKVVVEPSIWLGLEHFLREDFVSLQYYQGFLTDAAARSAGFTHLGLKVKLYQIYRSTIYAEIGTALSYRENWNTLAGYVEEKNYTGSGRWQTKWMYLSGGLSYYFYLTKRHDLSLTAWYGHYDQTITFMLGYRFWFSTVFKHQKPCNCPFDKYNKKYKRK